MRLFRSDFLRSFLTLITGTTLAQAIPILLSPILSRLFTPEEFGLFALFASIAGAFAVVAAGRYEGAVMLPREDQEAAHLMSAGFRVTLWLSLALAVLAVAAEFLIWDHVEMEPAMRWWMLFLPLFVFMYGLTQLLTNWYVRKKQFKKVALGRILQSLFTNGSMLAFGFIGLSFWGIFWGNFIGLVLLSLVLLILFKAAWKQLGPNIRRTEVKSVALRYKDFPLANGPQSLIDMFQVNGIIYLIAAFFSNVITGLYSFAYRILMAPMNLVGSSMAQVFYQKASETWNAGNDIRPLMRKTMLFSALLISPVLLILLFFGPAIFAWVFGEEWREAGEYSRILSLWFCLDFVRAPISQVPLITGKIRKLLAFTFTGNLLLLACMIAGGIWLQDITQTFMLLSACMSLYTLVLLGWLYRIAKMPAASA